MVDPLGVIWSSVVGKADIRGYDVAADSSLLEIPSLNVNLQTGCIEVECQGYQDRPPHESYNHLRTPFLPWSWPSSEGAEESREAFVSSQDHFMWSERLRLFKQGWDPLFGELENVQRKSMCGQVVEVKARRSKHEKCRQKRHSKFQALLEEYPFGPSNLYSSSNLDTFSFKNDPQDIFTFHADHTASALTKKFHDLGTREESKLFLHSLDRAKEIKIKEEKFAKYSRVFGIATSKTQDLAALKYWEGVAVAKLIPDAEGSSIVSKFDSTAKSIADVTFVDFLDAYAIIDVNGSIHLMNYETDVIASRWNKIFENQVETFEWACLSETKSSPYLIRTGTRNSIHLFDVRSGKSRLELIRWDDSSECLGGFCSSASSPFQFYGATSHSTILLDERFTGKSISRWDHPISREGHKIAAGCDAAFIAGNGLEYVATYWGDGEVVLRAVDWNHRPCQERAEGFKEKIRLSCQIPIKSRSRYEHNIYPVLRGRPVTVPSIQYLHNNCSNLMEKSLNRLQVPWTGLKMLPGDDTLTLISVNAVGDFFAADIVRKKPYLPLVYEAKNFGFDEHIDFEAPSTSTSHHREKMIAPEFYSPFWLIEPPIFKSKDEAKRVAKDWISHWQRSYLDPIHQRWIKISFASYIQKRDGLPKDQTGMGICNPIPVVAMPVLPKKKRRKKKDTKDAKEKKEKRKYKPRRIRGYFPEYSPIPALPELGAFDDSQLGLFGTKIMKILDGRGEDVYSTEIDVSDEESMNLLRPPSQVERMKRARSESLLQERPIAELAVSTQDFAAGLETGDLFMISTQQSQPSQAAAAWDLEQNNVTAQSNQFEFDNNERDSFALSQSQSQTLNQSLAKSFTSNRPQKKKKKYQMGF